MILLSLLLAAAPARGIETSKPAETPTPLSDVAVPPVAQPAGSMPSLALPTGIPQIPAVEIDRYWEGARDIPPRGEAGPQLPYWKAAFDENARVVAGRAAFKAVPGLVSISHFATRNHQGVPTPGLQLVLEQAADMARVLTKMAEVDPALRDYRLIESRTPGERPVLYLVRPARTGMYRDAKEAAALAEERRVEAHHQDALDIASGNVAPVDYGRNEDRLVRDYIEQPGVFDSRRQFLRYLILGEKPEGMLTDPESLNHYLAVAVGSGSRRLWAGHIGQELQHVGFFFQKRETGVALSPEAPADLAQPTSLFGLPTELYAYGVKEGKPRRFPRPRQALRWASGWAGLGVAGTVGFGSIPAVVAGLVWAYHVSGALFFCGFFLSLLLSPYLLKGLSDSVSWTIRMVKLYRAIPKA